MAAWSLDARIRTSGIHNRSDSICPWAGTAVPWGAGPYTGKYIPGVTLTGPVPPLQQPAMRPVVCPHATINPAGTTTWQAPWGNQATPYIGPVTFTINLPSGS